MLALMLHIWLPAGLPHQRQNPVTETTFEGDESLWLHTREKLHRKPGTFIARAATLSFT
jgi:hypothetical protein